MRVHCARKSYPPANHGKPSYVRLRLEPAKGPDHLESVAFLVKKLDSFYGNLLGPWSESIVLELGLTRICQKTDKKNKRWHPNYYNPSLGGEDALINKVIVIGSSVNHR